MSLGPSFGESGRSRLSSHHVFPRAKRSGVAAVPEWLTLANPVHMSKGQRARVTIVAIAALALGSGVALAAQSERQGRALEKPLRNGLVAYSYDGDIYVGDPATGKTKPITRNPAAPGKDAGAKFPTTTYNNVVHHWFYESWMWAPDGRRLLVLENLRTRPWVVDIETDTVTKLPWLADSMPSWQRVTG